MARINIEECWWSDLRRSKLAKILGNENTADAAAIRMWRLAQDFWKDGRRLVPIHIWEHFEFGKECIESGLAILDGSFVYVRGSSEHLEWAAEQRENAKKAGKKSVEAREKKYGTSQPIGGKGSKKSEITERQPNDDRTESNGTEPSVSVSGSGIVSGSESGSGISISTEANKFVPRIVKPSKNCIVKISHNQEVEIGRDLIISWADTYPKEFLDEQLKMARNWVLSNPHKAPKSAWGRFLNGWFTRGWEKYRTTLKSQPMKITIDDLNEMLGVS